MNSFEIYNATEKDASLIAKIVCLAINDEGALIEYCGKNYIEVLTKISKSKETQYSYTNTLIGIDNERNFVGGIIGYDGALLNSLRETTLKIIEEATHHRPIIADETEEGEFYIDSIAVLPLFRKRGVATELIKAMCSKAFNDGHSKVGLIVETNNMKAQFLYEKLGFKIVGRKIFFGHNMLHMQISK